MKYFIYPRGLNGETLGEIIHFFEPKSEIIFIDDADESSSLKALKSEIKSSPVLIASTLHQNRLCANLHEVGIKNFYNGIELFSRKNQDYIEECLGDKLSKSVAIFLRGLSGEKHIGTLDQELQERGVEIFYIASSREALELSRGRIGDRPVFIAEHEFLTHISGFGVFVGTNGGFLHEDVKSINLGHSLTHLLQLHYHSSNVDEYRDVIKEWYLNMSDYLVVSNKIEYDHFMALMRKYPHKTQILRNGYLGFDEMDKVKSVSSKLRKVVVAPKRVLCKELFLKFLDELTSIKDFEIILRFHPMSRDRQVEEESLKRLGYRGNFSVDTSLKLTKEFKSECLSIITDFSTMAYSFPLSVGRPVIIYGIDKSPSVEGIEFVDERLHIYVHNSKEAIEALCHLQANPAVHEEEIEHYKNEVLYPMATASGHMADLIVKILNKEI